MIRAQLLPLKDWREHRVKIYKMWLHFREQPRTGLALKNPGYAAWEDGHFFMKDNRGRINRVLNKILSFGKFSCDQRNHQSDVCGTVPHLRRRCTT